MSPIKDRKTAGKLLSIQLKKQEVKAALVLGLPRGGVPVAWEIAKDLDLPLDVLIVKKITASSSGPDFAIGAMSEDGQPIWSTHNLINVVGAQSELSNLAQKTHTIILEQIKLWRQNRPPLALAGKNIIVVDDGMATGLTMKAAIEYLRGCGVAKIIVAVPVASLEAIKSIQLIADHVVVLQSPNPFYAVDQWYEDFAQVSDDTVTELLQCAILSTDNVKSVRIPTRGLSLSGEISIPEKIKRTVIFAHGGENSYNSPRSRKVAKVLSHLGFATLQFDLFSSEEEDRHLNAFSISLLRERLDCVAKWIENYEILKNIPMTYVGESTRAAASMVEVSKNEGLRTLITQRDGPYMAEDVQPRHKCPVLLIVGGKKRVSTLIKKPKRFFSAHKLPTFLAQDIFLRSRLLLLRFVTMLITAFLGH